MAAYLSSVLAVLLAVNTATALVCYHCDSSKDTFCSIGFLSFTQATKTCEDGGFLDRTVPHQCAKFTAKTSDGKEYVARDCVVAVGNTLCNAIAKTAGVFSSVQAQENIDVSCTLCDGDKCNSASTFTGFTLLALIVASLAFML